MRQRLALRRILLQRLFLIQSTRPITSSTSVTFTGRPQLPFLTIPVTTRSRVRYFTTKQKEWLKHEGRLVIRYSVSIWGSIFCIVGIALLLNEEILEKSNPTPHEWSIITRVYLRGAKAAAKDHHLRQFDWVKVINASRKAQKRLEDPKIDGAGIKDLLDEPLSREGVGAVGKDVSAKSENWRRGYYEVLMLVAQAAEQLDGWVRDNTRNFVYPPEMVIGPSNPRPKPLPAWTDQAPKEEDCEVAFEPADTHYLRILTTKGFTNRQKIDAALAYASFLDFKQLPDAAEQMYQWALSLAMENTSPSLVDMRTYTINDKATQPPENVLSALTATATHKARHGDLSAALPIFVSVLRARRALPQTPLPGQERPQERSQEPSTTPWQWILDLASPPEYPPPPDDGSRPPWRHPKELCEEAGLKLYIGEILYSSKDVKANREEGLAWTRDAVDLAEEQLRKIGTAGGDKEARQTCRDCLGVGLGNWSTMVARLAMEEEEKKKAGPKKSAFGFWSETKTADGRWAAEEEVVKQRLRRTREMLLEVEPPPIGLAALFKA